MIRNKYEELKDKGYARLRKKQGKSCNYKSLKV
jgi:hypothetical protein